MKSFFKLIKGIIKKQFFSGILIVVPLILTYVVLRFLFDVLDGLLAPYISKLFGFPIPGLGIIATILLIILAGFFVRSIIGASIYKYGDKLLTKLPIVRIFYMAAKKLIEALSLPNNQAFKEVVMLEYPRRGCWAIGFSTSKIKFIRKPDGYEEMIGVFVPSTPTPVSGFIVFVPGEDVIPLNISIEEGLKLIISGGIVAPSVIEQANQKPIAEV